MAWDTSPARPPPSRTGPVRPTGAASPSPVAVRLLSDLLTGDWDGAEATDTRTRREASGLVAAHLQWHLERGLRSLPLVERL